MLKVLFEAIRAIFFVIACLVWLIVGTAWWLCLLTRALVVFTAVFLTASLTRCDPPAVVNELNALAAIWPGGFRQAYMQFYGSPPTKEPDDFDWRRLAIESSSTILLITAFAFLAMRPTGWLSWLLFPTVGGAAFIAELAHGNSTSR